MVEGDPFAVGRPPGGAGKTTVEGGQLQQVTTIRIASPYLGSSSAAGLKYDLSAIGDGCADWFKPSEARIWFCERTFPPDLESSIREITHARACQNHGGST
jgi:hypothetical protein